MLGRDRDPATPARDRPLLYRSFSVNLDVLFVVTMSGAVVLTVTVLSIDPRAL